jgi:amino-acid N-acetyltransferase
MPTEPIVRLQPEHLRQLEKLLDRSGLPWQDCAEQSGNFYGIFDSQGLIAAGGLEPAGNYALLRSLAVREKYRGRGMARVITDFLLARAAAEGRSAVYLLTETAAGYFEKLGFGRITREQVPDEITRTLQFTSLCPDSAVCLYLRLPRKDENGIAR